MRSGAKRSADRRTLQRLQPSGVGDPRGHLVLVGDEEARHAVFDDLGRRALGEGQHRRSAGHRLDHDHPERLRPADRHQERVRVGEQPLLACAADLADVGDLLAVEMRLDLLGEEPLLARLHDAGEDQPPPHGLRDADGALRALLGHEAPDPQQVVVLLVADRPVVDVDRVVDDVVDDRGVGRHAGLRPADADDGAVAAVDRVIGLGVAVERAVHGVHERRVEAIRHRQRRVAAVVVHDVERGAVLRCRVDRAERAPDVVGLEQRSLDAVGVRLVEQRVDRRRASASPGRRRARRRGRGRPARRTAGRRRTRCRRSRAAGSGSTVAPASRREAGALPTARRARGRVPSRVACIERCCRRCGSRPLCR